MKHFLYLVSSLLLAITMLSMPAHAQGNKQTEPVASSINSEKVTPAAAMATININTADAATLADRLNGIGAKKAEAIVQYREQHGPFKTVEDLLNVKGIGEATLEKNRQLITVN